MPTVIDLLNLDVKVPHVGSSLLREHRDRKVFFQNPYSEGFMGARKGPWKWMEKELYHVENDPQERHNLAALHPEVAVMLERESRQFFASVDAWHRQRSLRADPPVTSEELDFSESLISDGELLQRVSESVRGIRLVNCLMLTEEGITALFHKCPHLESLNLLGVTELTDALFEQRVPANLQKLNLSSACRLSDRGVGLMVQACPRLWDLSLNGQNMTDVGLGLLRSPLSYFKLREGHQISEEGFLQFLHRNPSLHRLVLEDCPYLTERILPVLKSFPLEQLWIHNAPGICQSDIDQLRTLPLRSLVVESVVLVEKSTL
jgi:hypothetical protein